ncbi:MAG: hypothetical protein IPM69_10375 [Ignavibacteria bacterium]|nr:hypothetical protein [Ignavibacteria bacterium]
MQTDLTNEQINEFNQLFNRANERMEGIVILGDYRPSSLGFFDKLKVKKSIKDYEKCLSIMPNHWQSMLLLAKVHQRLGEHSTSLSLLENALTIELTNHNIPQEASLECIHLDNIEKAIIYSEEAIKRKPNDIVLLGNHAMNLLIASRDKESIETITHAIKLDPQDGFNLQFQKVINEVINGKRSRPTCKNAMK